MYVQTKRTDQTNNRNASQVDLSHPADVEPLPLGSISALQLQTSQKSLATQQMKENIMNKQEELERCLAAKDAYNSASGMGVAK